MPQTNPRDAYRPETLAIGKAITILATARESVTLLAAPDCARKFGSPTASVVIGLGFRLPRGDAVTIAGRLVAQDLRAGRRPTMGRIMRKYLLVAAACLAFAAVNVAVPVEAQDSGAKKMTPQRQKMKDCAVKWRDEKAQKNVSGRAAYRAFMKDCLKS